ncbi:MAG TPA: hypothetical protein DDW30_08445 [Clostridiales bacterium]|nr:hypothetical protein [Clostridiales bacterium]
MEKTKSAKLRTASRLVGYIGIGACLLGAFVYLLLHEIANASLEKLLGKFDVKSLIYVGIAAAAFLVVAVILRIASASAKRNEAYEAEAEETEAPAEEPVEETPVEAPVETVSAEDEEAARKAAEKAAAMEGGKTFVAYIGRNIPEKQREAMAKVGEFTKKNAKVIVAVAATLVVTNMISKRKAEKETTRRRQNFFRSLGC